MEENTIFQKAENQRIQNQPSSEPFPQPPQVPGSPTPPLSQQPQPSISPQTPLQGSQPPSPPPPPPEISGIPRILKILGGLFVFLILVIVFFIFILPRFRGGEENITLTYWGLWEDKRVMDVIIQDFQKENPSITVNYEKQDPKDYKDRLLTRISNGTGPDIFRYHNTWYPMISDILLPLPNEVIEKEEFENSYYPVHQKDLVKNGAIYGIPLQIDTLSLYVNTEILRNAGKTVPKTWDEFISTAQGLTVKDGGSQRILTAGAAIGTFDNVTHAPDILSLMLLQNNANLSNLLETQKASRDALDLYTQFALSDQNIWDDTLDPSILAFSKGSLGMYFGYSWDFFIIKANNPSLQFEVHPVPYLPGREISVASYWVEGVSSKSKNQDAAFLFMEYLSRKETLQKLYAESSKTRLFGEPYPRKDLAETLSDNPNVFPFVQQAEGADSSFFSSDTNDGETGINSRMNVYLGNAVRSILNGTSPDSALEVLSQGVTQVLSDYESR